MGDQKLGRDIDVGYLIDICARAAAPTAAHANLVRVARVIAPMALSGFLTYLGITSDGVVDASISAFLMIFSLASFLLGGYAVVKFWD